jgi:hypothetical protein
MIAIFLENLDVWLRRFHGHWIQFRDSHTGHSQPPDTTHAETQTRRKEPRSLLAIDESDESIVILFNKTMIIGNEQEYLTYILNN